MNTKVGLQHDKARQKPWRVYWFGEADPETGRQRKYVKSFKHSREAREFQTNKQADLNRGEPRDRPEDVTLGRLPDEFWEARVANLSYASQDGYKNTVAQLREHFGDTRPLGRIEGRHAETFMGTRERRDGRSGDLSSHAKAQHLKYCRAIFGAAADWGCFQSIKQPW